MKRWIARGVMLVLSLGLVACLGWAALWFYQSAGPDGFMFLIKLVGLAIGVYVVVLLALVWASFNA
ncbi:MAG: hypothetical protein KGJ86_00105 [Chloroflexota bacterium]|nr:hypothetical protein [Chloroflexota bacterium]